MNTREILGKSMKRAGIAPSWMRSRSRFAATIVAAGSLSLTGAGLGSVAGGGSTGAASASSTGSGAGISVTVGSTGAPEPAPVAFEVGAASVNITPPPYSVASNAAFVPACGPTPQAVAALWPGKRLFAFEEPYIPAIDPSSGEYVVGDPYCDANHAGHYQAPYVAGPPGQDHWPLTVQQSNPLKAVVTLYALGTKRVATVVVDSIGLFNVTMDQIRADARSALLRAHLPPIPAADIFVSSTHDESAPDPIGLWGPDGSNLPGNSTTSSVLTSTALTSGVDNYYLAFLARRVAGAIVRAYRDLQPAELKLAYASLPPNVQECWSSYPYIADHVDPVMQAIDPKTGKVIFTLVNGNTHVETFAFSGVAADTTMFSADWAGFLRQDLAAHYGGVGVEMSGLVGSVETPAFYPPGTQVVNVPGPFHGVNGAVDGCSSVYPNPTGASPITSAHAFVRAYGAAMASAAEAALAGPGARIYGPSQIHHLIGVRQRICIQLESNFFAAAFASGIFADRPAYVDPTCSVGAAFDKAPAPAYHLAPGTVQGANPLWIKTDVGVVTIGPAQLAYVPGEMFPFTAMRGHLDQAQMPFPTNCYEPPAPATPATPATPANYYCGSPLPMTPFVLAKMTEPYRFVAGLGEDMIGYMMPPGDFVGSQDISQTVPLGQSGLPVPSGPTGVPPSVTVNVPEVNEQPWLAFELASSSWNDRFGQGHADDSESVGPHAGIEVTQALAKLLGGLAARGIGRPEKVLPGLYVDATGMTSDSPFPYANAYALPGLNSSPKGFTGAVGVEVTEPGGAKVLYCVGEHPSAKVCQAKGVRHASSWATFDGFPDPGTAGTALPYSVSTAGVMLPAGGQGGRARVLLVDVYAGAGQKGASSPVPAPPAPPAPAVP